MQLATSSFHNAWGLLAASMLALCVVACSENSKRCSADPDCYLGERCGSSGTCEQIPHNSPNSVNGGNNDADGLPDGGNGGQDTSMTADTSNPNTGDSSMPGQDASNEDTGPTFECLVDLFGNQCTDDQWEPNDGYANGAYNDQTPFQSNTYCVGGDLVVTQRTLSGRLCGGDSGDGFRFVVADNSAPRCLNRNVTFRFTVEITTPCDPSAFEVLPYTFGRRPDTACAADDTRCTVSADGMTHTIEWIWNGADNQILDPRIQIVPTAPNVQLDYEITFDII